jgi:hypothetical protein
MIKQEILKLRLNFHNITGIKKRSLWTSQGENLINANADCKKMCWQTKKVQPVINSRSKQKFKSCIDARITGISVQSIYLCKMATKETAREVINGKNESIN